MTQELAKEIVSSSVRCTQATLRAFGLEYSCEYLLNVIPKTGSGCLQFLTNTGFKCQRVNYSGMKLRDISKCCGISTYKNYFIKTKNHAMALINGILIDTEGKGFDKRIIEFIWEVTK